MLTAERKFDPTKPCRTRDGRAVRIYAIDGAGKRPIHGAINGVIADWPIDGRTWGFGAAEAPSDLVNIPQKIESWLNVYECGIGYETRERANDNALPGRIACVHVVCEEGEGL